MNKIEIVNLLEQRVVVSAARESKLVSLEPDKNRRKATIQSPLVRLRGETRTAELLLELLDGGVSWQVPAQVSGLPDPQPGVFFLVNMNVFKAAEAAGRRDVLYAPLWHKSCRVDPMDRTITVSTLVGVNLDER
jgi:hypothetical protein